MQPKLADWLVRGSKPKKVRKPLRRTRLLRGSTPVKRVSKKRARENRIYTVKRKAFLEANQMCQLSGPLISAGVEPHCTFETTEVHHMCRRLGGNYLDERTWAATCATCHRYVETHAKLARTLGLIRT